MVLHMRQDRNRNRHAGGYYKKGQKPMRLRGIVALCSLAFAKALYAAPADDVQALLEKGDAKAAYELGRKHRDQLGNPAFDFYFGIAAIDSGNAGEGVLARDTQGRLPEALAG